MGLDNKFKKKKIMDKNTVKVIKISKDALFEFIYEHFNEREDLYLDVDSTTVSNWFDIDFEKGNFIYCAIRSEDEEGNFLTMPKSINLKKVMDRIPDTTDCALRENIYKEYTMDELIELSKE